MNPIIVLLFSCFMSAASFAAGTINLSGRVHSFSPEKIDILDKKKIYSILRKKLGPEQDKRISQSKVGTQVHLLVPFEAVVAVRSTKPANK